MTSIGAYAFGSCPGLTSIEIPGSVTSIDTNPFIACNGLTSIVVDPANTKYDSRDGCNAIIEKETNSLVSGCQNTVIPISVSTIASYAFAGCTGMTSFKIPSSVTRIRGSAFDGCTGLEFISVFAKTPPTLGQEVFTNTNNCPIY
ncbi:MAG: leucine-rich repeat domain-containing protein, partial [Bacteroidales bacterium]|nr:leucine-rich repeat domain-containing protein [Bacteroidales bacterium]